MIYVTLPSSSRRGFSREEPLVIVIVIFVQKKNIISLRYSLHKLKVISRAFADNFTATKESF